MTELYLPVRLSGLENFLAIPSIWLPNSDIDPQQEVEWEVQRVIATRQMLTGQITWDDYEQVLDASGIDPIAAYEDWDNGIKHCDG